VGATAEATVAICCQEPSSGPWHTLDVTVQLTYAWDFTYTPHATDKCANLTGTETMVFGPWVELGETPLVAADCFLGSSGCRATTKPIIQARIGLLGYRPNFNGVSARVRVEFRDATGCLSGGIVGSTNFDGLFAHCNFGDFTPVGSGCSPQSCGPNTLPCTNDFSAALLSATVSAANRTTCAAAARMASDADRDIESELSSRRTTLEPDRLVGDDLGVRGSGDRADAGTRRHTAREGPRGDAPLGARAVPTRARLLQLLGVVDRRGRGRRRGVVAR